MKDNTINNVYIDRIYELVDEYISTLEDGSDIYNKQCFAGLIKYISLNFGKPDYKDLALLDNLWNIYSSLCYKYKQTVSIERYCMLIGISRQTFYSWLNGVTMVDYSEELGCTRSDMMKKWDAESESSWQDEASTGNPGPMFVLKARRGWTETAPVQIQQNSSAGKTTEQIAQEMGLKFIEEKEPDMDF